MKREIKFRAWDKMYKTMTLPFTLGELLYWYETHSVEFSGAQKRKDLSDYSFKIKTAQELLVMQYTGLKDKNGKEIYEGDVVEYTYETFQGEDSVVGVVLFGDGGFGLQLSTQWIGIAGKDSEDFEVRGNVYENPNIKIDE